MPVELISWLSAVLVVASVVIKIVTANLITRRKTEVSQLQSELRKQVGVCESLVEHRASLDDNLEFFERRMIEDREVKVELEIDLDAYVADHRKHLEDLGYDPDEDPDPEAIYEEAATAGSEPSQEFQQADALPQHATIAVLPPAVGDADKLFLPDAVITELLSGGGKVIDRSTINQRLIDNGMDLRQVLDNEEYFRLHAAAAVDAVVIINSRLTGSGIGTATCRVIHFPSGEILLSTSYEQPGKDERSDDFENLTQTARQLATAIRGVIDD
ncbi:MAG: hypothetical protein QF689_15210 [Candidatus Latescibacteria bacterium]|nr:hypothetical protein [Candidatus Latescibacterota bacterium]